MRANKKKILENQFRALVRNEIAKIIREDEQTSDKEDSIDQQAPEKEEPKVDRGQTLEKITASFVRTLRNNLQDISADELSDAFNSVMGHMGYGKDAKMNVLMTIKSKIGV